MRALRYRPAYSPGQAIYLETQAKDWCAFPRATGGKAYPIEPGSRRYLLTRPPIPSIMPLPVKELVRDRRVRPHLFRVNSDVTRIEGTHLQWVYSSALCGVKRVVISVVPRPVLASRSLAAPIRIDGKLDPTEWPGEPRAKLPFTRTSLYFRHSVDALFMAFTRPGVPDRRGNPSPWKTRITRPDGPVWQDDSFEVFIQGAGTKILHLGLSASGARFDALFKNGKEDASWNGSWKSAVRRTSSAFAAELEIPYKVLEKLGAGFGAINVNVQANQHNLSREIPVWPGINGRIVTDIDGIGEPLVSLSPAGRQRCTNFVPLGITAAASYPTRTFLVRLHFAELRRSVNAGESLFDVFLQGKKVLSGLDVVQHSGGLFRALKTEWSGIEASDQLVIELAGRKRPQSWRTAPILNGIEIRQEDTSDRN